MQSIDYSGLDKLDMRFAKVLDELPDMRRDMHSAVALGLQQAVRINIAASGVNDSGGKVGGWQERHVGSGGGYAAVRPIPGGQRGNNPGAITNYLESGHKTRASKAARRGRPRQANARAYGFYARTRAQAQDIALGAANRFADEAAERLGD